MEVGNAFLKKGYRIKIFNTINFKKSMHYNRVTCSPLKMRRTALFYQRCELIIQEVE